MTRHTPPHPRDIRDVAATAPAHRRRDRYEHHGACDANRSRCHVCRPSSMRASRRALGASLRCARARRWDWISAIARVDGGGAHRRARAQTRGSRRAGGGHARWSFRGGVLCGAGARRGVARRGAGAGRRSWIVLASTDRALGTLPGGCWPSCDRGLARARGLSDGMEIARVCGRWVRALVAGGGVG